MRAPYGFLSVARVNVSAAPAGADSSAKSAPARGTTERKVMEVTLSPAGRDVHPPDDRSDARAHDALARDLHAALLADAEPAIEPARRARRARAQCPLAVDQQRRGQALTLGRLKRPAVHGEL